MLLTAKLRGEKDFSPLIASLKKEKKPVLVTGISSALRDLFPAAVTASSDEKALILLSDERAAADMGAALASVFPRTLFFPPRDFSLAKVDSTSLDFSRERLNCLVEVLRGEFDIVVSTPEAVSQATLPPERMEKSLLSLAVGDEMAKEALIESLYRLGYETCHRVEGEGQFATRGDIVDVFPTGMENPVRVEFFGDEIDAMGYFDVATQRRVENVRRIRLTPSRELLLGREDLARLGEFLREEIENSAPNEKEKRVYIRSVIERMENGLEFPRDQFLSLVYRHATFMDYFKEGLVFLYGQTDAKESLDGAARLLSEEIKLLVEEKRAIFPKGDLCLLESFEDFAARLRDKPCLLMENFYAGKSAIEPAGIFQFHTRTSSAPFRDGEGLFETVSSLREEGFAPLIISENSLSAENLISFLKEREVDARLFDGTEAEIPEGAVGVITRSFPEAALVKDGFELGSSRFAVLTDAPALSPKRRKAKDPVKKEAKKKLLSYQELEVGDYVVHSAHGIGVFRGVENMKSADGSYKDFIKIAYAGSDVLYVPCSHLDSVSKYIGPKSDSANLKLHKLGGSEWQKAKLVARKSAKNIAKELIALYARRQRTPGFAFSPDTTWQAEFEEAFPYGETAGQLQATQEIKEDMEKPVPMDRLLCGDVGFGKTEVAVRGIFKCVMDNKQAAILVPTTILAWQHYQTLLARFKGYPVRIEMLSRFRTKKEQAKILERLKEGEIDILVGTHRLLQKDVEFPDLGFLVIDEEQRFGVTHKERLKELSYGVDVLTLTATPIPRTLNMALGGIKDMSLLEEAPEDRYPVQTYVLEYDRGLIVEAIRRELRRRGQVFYLNNNIEELEATLPFLQREFPEAGIAVAHGKLDKDSLSDIWKDMMDKKLDILLCTTIIETGVDVPDANTLIVENADHFGLSQLHQIRGRVGRSDRKAYAYLTYRKGKMLSELSVKRLEAIREYTRFGSGFQIALRDLEIRGAGNLLGAEQSGHLDSVGYDMYMKILSDAVLEEKGEKKPPATECLVEIGVDAYIPEKYVPVPSERMDLYRKIASIRRSSDAEDVEDEMSDRFGEVPRSVHRLFDISLLRATAEKLCCEKISQRQNKVVFTFESVSEEAMLLLSAIYASRLTLSLSGKPAAILTLKEKTSVSEQCKEFLLHLDGFMKDLNESQSHNGKE